jgi:hypothetical protein
MKWNNDESGVYIGCENGSVYQILIPSPSQVDNKETYLFEDAKIQKWTITIMEF